MKNLHLQKSFSLTNLSIPALALNLLKGFSERSKKILQQAQDERERTNQMIIVIYAIFFTLTLLTTPLFAGPYCIDNSEHLAKSGDTKEWHSVACDCSCEAIKNGYCTECGHRQNSPTYTIATPRRINVNTTKHAPSDISNNPQDILEKLATKYVKNKYDE